MKKRLNTPAVCDRAYGRGAPAWPRRAAASFNQGLKRTGKFVPIYFVYWQSPKNRAEGYGSVASVKLFAPSKTLMSLRVEESKYIHRPPLVFTNLDLLLRNSTE